MHVPKHLRAIVEVAEAAGWTYDRTKNYHPRLTPPEGLIDPHTGRLATPVTFAGTPSDKRGVSNTVAQLRRAGVQIPHRGKVEGKRPRPEDRSGPVKLGHLDSIPDEVWEAALEQTGGDTSRFRVQPDGSIVVTNPGQKPKSNIEELRMAPPRRPIAHGTYGGYQAHLKRKVPIPADDSCGCRQAYRDYKAGVTARLRARQEGKTPPVATSAGLKPIPHGTRAGYLAHLRRGVPTTAECGCRHAAREYDRERRRKRSGTPAGQPVSTVPHVQDTAEPPSKAEETTPATPGVAGATEPTTPAPPVAELLRPDPTRIGGWSFMPTAAEYDLLERIAEAYDRAAEAQMELAQLYREARARSIGRAV